MTFFSWIKILLLTSHQQNKFNSSVIQLKLTSSFQVVIPRHSHSLAPSCRLNSVISHEWFKKHLLSLPVFVVPESEVFFDSRDLPQRHHNNCLLFIGFYKPCPKTRSVMANKEQQYNILHLVVSPSVNHCQIICPWAIGSSTDALLNLLTVIFTYRNCEHLRWLSSSGSKKIPDFSKQQLWWKTSWITTIPFPINCNAQFGKSHW